MSTVAEWVEVVVRERWGREIAEDMSTDGMVGAAVVVARLVLDQPHSTSDRTVEPVSSWLSVAAPQSWSFVVLFPGAMKSWISQTSYVLLCGSSLAAILWEVKREVRMRSHGRTRPTASDGGGEVLPSGIRSERLLPEKKRN